MADADGDPVLVVHRGAGCESRRRAAPVAAQLRAVVWPDRRCTVMFVGGGYYPAVFTEMRKLITHAISMSADNTESALARLLRPHYSRGRGRGARPAARGVHPLRRSRDRRRHPARPARPGLSAPV